MKENSFNIGDLVRLNSDFDCRYPMTIERRDEDGLFRVVWLDANGQSKYSAFHGDLLTKVITRDNLVK